MVPLEQFVLDNAQVSSQCGFSFLSKKYFRESLHVIRARTRVIKSLMKQLMAIHIEELIQIFGIKLLILFKAWLTIPPKSCDCMFNSATKLNDEFDNHSNEYKHLSPTK